MFVQDGVPCACIWSVPNNEYGYNEWNVLNTDKAGIIYIHSWGDYFSL